MAGRRKPSPRQPRADSWRALEYGGAERAVGDKCVPKDLLRLEPLAAIRCAGAMAASGFRQAVTQSGTVVAVGSMEKSAAQVSHTFRYFCAIRTHQADLL
jgi:hypothetical protein